MKRISLIFLTVFYTIFLTNAQEAGTQKWTIGVLTGSGPMDLHTPKGISNPVFTAEMVTDLSVDIVSHPCLIKEGSKFYLFFTAKDKASGSGGIGVAESVDGLSWNYRKMAIVESDVVSHPNVFKWKNEYYMVPETTSDSTLRLYRAVDFPDKWMLEETLIKGGFFVSPTVFQHKKTWWMFTSPKGNSSLRLFYSDHLKGPWVEHPKSPIVDNNPMIARPAGKPLEIDGKLYRLGMDCGPSYGYQVFALHVIKLSKKEYGEKIIEDPLIKASSKGWNARAMHHVDAIKIDKDNWIAVVDALGF
jgi:hypothetical protein